MRDAVGEDDVCEYAVAYDDEVVRRDVVREGIEGGSDAGVGGLECGVEEDGRAEVVRDRVSLELRGVVAGAGCVGDDEDARGPEGTEGLRPGNLDGTE
jgi:hypothetical protein